MSDQGKKTAAYRTVTGTGRTVVCLHSSTSSSKQFQALSESLADRYRVVAVDLYGYGKTADWPGESPLKLDDEVALFADIIEDSIEPVHLLGHSYGGAVAAMAALRYGKRVASLTMYEPVLFRLLEEAGNSTAAAAEIATVEATVRAGVAEGRVSEAAQHFIDYWSGKGAWGSFPEWRQAGLSGKMIKVVSDFDAVLGTDYALDRFERLDVPTLLVNGLASPRASRRVMELLLQALPDVNLRSLAGVGHMGPVTHADQVNALFADFLDHVATRRGQTSAQRVA